MYRRVCWADERTMNDLMASAPGDQNALSRSLRPRHVAMITIGGIIGAGLFVGSSVAIAAAGAAIASTGITITQKYQ